jgi:hypothetical protein
MKLKRFAASAALAALTSVGMLPMAQAAFVDDLGTLGSTATTFGNTFDVGETTVLDDWYTFTITSASTVVGGTLDLYLGLWGVDVQSVSVKLHSSDTWIPDATKGDGFSFVGLGEGLYDLRLTGDVGYLGGAYAGAIKTIASAAPEPETYLMMMLGLAGVAFAARRQRKI